MTERKELGSEFLSEKERKPESSLGAKAGFVNKAGRESLPCALKGGKTNKN